MAGVDPDFLAALPPELQAEVLEQARRERVREASRARAAAASAAEAAAAAAGGGDGGGEGGGGAPAAPASVAAAGPADAPGDDLAAALASFPPDVREEVLLTADEGMLASLPPALQAEAATLRRRLMMGGGGGGIGITAAAVAAAGAFMRVDLGDIDGARGGPAAWPVARPRAGPGSGRSSGRGRVGVGVYGTGPPPHPPAPIDFGPPPLAEADLAPLVAALRLAPAPGRGGGGGGGGALGRIFANLAAVDSARPGVLRALCAPLAAVVDEAGDGDGEEAGLGVRLAAGAAAPPTAHPPSAVAATTARRAVDALAALARTHPGVAAELASLPVVVAGAGPGKTPSPAAAAKGKAPLVVTVDASGAHPSTPALALLLRLVRADLSRRAAGAAEAALALVEVVIGAATREAKAKADKARAEAAAAAAAAGPSSGGGADAKQPAPPVTATPPSPALEALPPALVRVLPDALASAAVPDAAAARASAALRALATGAPRTAPALRARLGDLMLALADSARPGLEAVAASSSVDDGSGAAAAVAAAATGAAAPGSRLLRVTRALAGLAKPPPPPPSASASSSAPDVVDPERVAAAAAAAKELAAVAARLDPLWAALSAAAAAVEGALPTATGGGAGAPPPPLGGGPTSAAARLLPPGAATVLPLVETFFVLAEARADAAAAEGAVASPPPRTTGAAPALLPSPALRTTPSALGATLPRPPSRLDQPLVPTAGGPGGGGAGAVAGALGTAAAASAAEAAQPFTRFAERHRRLLNAWVRQSPGLLDASLSPLLRTPRLLDFDNKRAHFRARMRREAATARSAAGVGGGRDGGPLRLAVRRAHVFDDSFHQLRMRSPLEMRAKLAVTFQGEEGIDAGGVTREWYAVMARAMFDPKAALFVHTPEGGTTFQPNPASVVQSDEARGTSHLDFFRFVGRVVGKALLDGQAIDAHFTRSFYKHMLGQPLTYADVEAVDPAYFRTLAWVLENDIEEGGMDLDLTFSEEADFFGRREVVEFVPGGAAVRVTNANKRDYVDLAAAHRMTGSIRDQTASFLAGFWDLVPQPSLAPFDAAQLELLISGLPTIDVADLRRHTEYAGGYTAASPVIQWFWEVVGECGPEDVARLVQFVTGTAKVPLDGFAALQGVSGPQRFQVHKAFGPPDRLPTAHTCFNQLDLVEYDTRDQLRDRLLLAIREGATGFAFG